MEHKNFLILYFFFFALVGCDIRDNKVEPEDGFTKIYNIDSAESNHFPLDIKELPDGGFLILGYDLQDMASCMVIRTDNEGKIIWSEKSNKFFNPLSNLLVINEQYIFICSNNSTLSIIKINDVSKNLEEIKTYTNLGTPLACCKTPGNGILIQLFSYDPAQTILLRLNSNFNKDNTFSDDGQIEYEINGSDLVNITIEDFKKYNKFRWPFLVSYVGEGAIQKIVYNGISSNDRVGLQFVDPISGNEDYRVNGYQFFHGVNSFTYLENNKIAISKFENEKNAFIPILNTDSLDFLNTTFISDFSTIQKNEILPYSQIKSSLATIKGRKLVIYTAELKNNKVGMFAYDAANGSFVGSKYFGNTYAYKIGNFVQTQDGGMAVVCQTYVAGRFGRICLFKLSADQANNFVN